MQPGIAMGLLRDIRDLAYRRVAAFERNAATSDERYAVVRAHIILHREADARRALERLWPEAEHETHAYRVLTFLRRLHFDRSSDREDMAKAALELLGTMGDASSYLKGETYFIAGYVHNLLDEYRQGARLFAIAANHYETADLAGPAAVACFNHAICHIHLVEKPDFFKVYAKLGELHQRCPTPAVELHYLRMQAYVLLDQEAYREALACLERCLDLARQEDRRRDLGGISCLSAIVALQIEAAGGPPRKAARIQDLDDCLTDEHRAILTAIERLAAMRDVTAAVAEREVAEWQDQRIPSIYQLLLYNVLLRKLDAARRPADLLAEAQRASRLAQDANQMFSVVDFRYYEAKARIELGQIAEARETVSRYEAEALALGTPKKVERAGRLGAYLRELDERLRATSGEERDVVIDIGSHTVHIDQREVSLGRSWAIEKLLVTLAQRGDEVSMDELYSEIYGGNYHPLTHGRRLSSLIMRARQTLGDQGLVLRRGGTVRLSPERSFRVKGQSRDGSKMRERQGLLLELIQAAGDGATISDLESKFPYTRRTLQYDLSLLVERRMVTIEGRTRSRRYFAEPSQKH